MLCRLQDGRNRGWKSLLSPWQCCLGSGAFLFPAHFSWAVGWALRTLGDVFSPGYFVWVGFCSILLRVWGKQTTWRTRRHFRTFLYGLFFKWEGPQGEVGSLKGIMLLPSISPSILQASHYKKGDLSSRYLTAKTVPMCKLTEQFYGVLFLYLCLVIVFFLGFYHIAYDLGLYLSVDNSNIILRPATS